MSSRILIGILVSAFCAAIGRGIVLAFGLDQKVARVLNIATTSDNLSTLVWITTGAVGLTALVLWLTLDMSNRLSGIFGESAEFALEFRGSQSEGIQGGGISFGARIHNNHQTRFLRYVGSTTYTLSGAAPHTTTAANAVELAAGQGSTILGPAVTLPANAPTQVMRLVVTVDYGFAGGPLTHTIEAVYDVTIVPSNLALSSSRLISTDRRRLRATP